MKKIMEIFKIFSPRDSQGEAIQARKERIDAENKLSESKKRLEELKKL
jgi:hypothetical protein